MEMMPLLICRGQRKGARRRREKKPPPDLPGSEEGDHGDWFARRIERREWYIDPRALIKNTQEQSKALLETDSHAHFHPIHLGGTLDL
jgi:hypothetical protein